MVERYKNFVGLLIKEHSLCLKKEIVREKLLHFYAPKLCYLF